MPYPHDDAKLKSWEQGLSGQIAKSPAPWNDYDTQIKAVCAVYDKHLTGVSGYVPLDWQIVKAIAWVESGAANAAWKTAPMQIGVNGDPGLRELLDKPAGKLILPQEYARVLTVSNVPVNGNLNIEAGVGYVLKIAANFGMQADTPPPPSGPALIQKAGSPQAASMFGNPGSGQLAWNFGAPCLPGLLSPGLFPPGLSTPSLLPAFGPVATPASTTPPPTAAAPHPASKPSKGGPHPAHGHHPARHKVALPKHLAIVSWKPLTLQFIAKHYNAGDGNYADKLQFALDIMSGKIKPEAAAQPAPKHAHRPQHPPMRVPSGRD